MHSPSFDSRSQAPLGADTNLSRELAAQLVATIDGATSEIELGRLPRSGSYSLRAGPWPLGGGGMLRLHIPAQLLIGVRRRIGVGLIQKDLAGFEQGCGIPSDDSWQVPHGLLPATNLSMPLADCVRPRIRAAQIATQSATAPGGRRLGERRQATEIELANGEQLPMNSTLPGIELCLTRSPLIDWPILNGG